MNTRSLNISSLYPVILDTRAGKAAALQQMPVSSVTLTDQFWEPRRRINREMTLPSQFSHLEETGAIDNFRRASGKKDIPFRGMLFSDSDVYKWLEAASWALASSSHLALSGLVETAVAEIAAAQGSDGYLNTYFLFEHAPERWTTINLAFNNMHELYCAGHLFQAAVAHYRVDGARRRLLDVGDALRGPYLRRVWAWRGPTAGRGRPPGDRDGAGRAVPRHRQPAVSGAGAVLHRRAASAWAG